MTFETDSKGIKSRSKEDVTFTCEESALPGSVTLAGVKSVADLFTKFTGATLPNSADVETGSPKAIGPGAKGPRPVRTASSWDQ
jgi:hypothetical protein